MNHITMEEVDAQITKRIVAFYEHLVANKIIYPLPNDGPDVSPADSRKSEDGGPALRASREGD